MRRLIVAIGLFVLPIVAAAQFPARDTTPIPRDLATALIHHNFGVMPTIVVGELPDTTLAPLVPTGARILGGIAHGSRRGAEGSSTTILEVSETPDSILNVIESTLERLGWRRPPMMSDPGERGGFVTRSYPVGYGGPMALTFCSDSAMLNASASQAGDVSIVRLMLSSDGMGMCSERREAMRRRRETLELPTLRPPPGATSVGGGHSSSGGSNGMDYRETSVGLGSRQSAAEVLAHFAPQLEEQGWKIDTRVSEPEVSVVTASKRAENGDTLRLLLMDNKFDARNHQASLRVWNPSARSW